MPIKTFTSFTEASNFAKEYAKNNRKSVELERDRNQWIVKIDNIDDAGSSNFSEKRLFATFSDAQSFSRNYAQKNNRIAVITKEGHKWSVMIDKCNDYFTSLMNTDFRHFDYEQHVKDEEEILRKIEVENFKQKVVERKKVRAYLREKEKYYRSLGSNQLEEIWENRHDLDIGTEEGTLLNSIMREIRGIE